MKEISDYVVPERYIEFRHALWEHDDQKLKYFVEDVTEELNRMEEMLEADSHKLLLAWFRRTIQRTLEDNTTR